MCQAGPGTIGASVSQAGGREQKPGAARLAHSAGQIPGFRPGWHPGTLRCAAVAASVAAVSAAALTTALMSTALVPFPTTKILVVVTVGGPLGAGGCLRTARRLLGPSGGDEGSGVLLAVVNGDIFELQDGVDLVEAGKWSLLPDERNHVDESVTEVTEEDEHELAIS